MKKLLFTTLIGTVVTVLIASQLYAQLPNGKDLPTVTVNSAKMSEKVWHNFQQEFEGATKVSWYKTDKSWLIKFTLNEIAQQVLYNNYGQQVYHISYVYENKMPDDVKAQVKNTYHNFLINQSLKVDQDNRTIWIVTLESPAKILFVRIEEGEMELVKEMDNAGIE
ncbi:MAG: hypothetical protein HYX40_06020 [Sphingobacteriales bacterium]|nr:hypothetical protein [Sphingobacteriales bacterium]